MSNWQYVAYSGAMPTTAPITKLATGTATKTLLQIATPSNQDIVINRWGISFDGSASGTSIECELLETGAVAATVTAHVASGVMPYNNASAPASLMTLGTGATGYNATAEGTITATRVADYELVQPTNQFVYDWPLKTEFHVPVSRFLRVRVTAAATVNAVAFVIWTE